MPNLNIPGTTIPGAFTPGDARPGDPGLQDNYVTLGTDQTVFGAKTFSALAGQGAIVTDDITIHPNPAVSASASMFLDAQAGQVWEFFCDGNTGEFGVYDKTGTQQIFTVEPAGGKHDLRYTGVGVFNALAANVIASKSSSYSMGYWDGLIVATASPITVTLRSASETPGRIVTIKQMAASGTCTVATTGGQTIDGAATYTGLSAQKKSVTVQSDGSNWLVVASN